MGDVPASAVEEETAGSVDTGSTAAARSSEEDLLEVAEVAAAQRTAALDLLDRQAQAQVDLRAQQREAERAARHWQLPVEGYRLTGRFGQSGSMWASSHTGLDFAAPSGTEIRAVAAGRVSEAGWAGAYGRRTVVVLEDGTETWYCHQSSISVSAGDVVASGDPIGAVGATGNVTGPHLHLEIRPGGDTPINPETALRDQGLRP